MIVEAILITVTVMLIGFGLCIGVGIGRQLGDRGGYRRGFEQGVEFARGQRRRQRGRPLYGHLRLLEGAGSPAEPPPQDRRAERGRGE